MADIEDLFIRLQALDPILVGIGILALLLLILLLRRPVDQTGPLRDALALWSCPRFTGHSGGGGLSCDELAGRAHFQP